MDIAIHFGLEPDVFYVPVEGNYGPPYGRAYGYYKQDKRRWKTIRLRDEEVVNFVNLRFMSEQYSSTPDAVIRMRSEGRNFRTINDHFHGEKYGKGDRDKKDNHDRRDKKDGDRDRENDRN
jgi:hypothetical protein